MDDNSGMGGGERPIKNLKGLLKFCMETTKNEDPTDTSAYDRMEPERREWLEEALQSMTTDTVDRVSECLNNIQTAQVNTEEGTQQIILALTELEDWVEDIDIAQDFITIKGLRIIPNLLSSEVSEIRWRCLELLANLCQNNPKVQAEVLAAQFLPPLLLLIEQDDNPTVRVKALYALSCLSRSNIRVQTELIEKGGLSVLVNTLQSEEEKLRIKSSFMISAMSRDNPSLKDALLDKDLVEQMILKLKGEHCVSHEHLMAAFVALVDKHAGFMNFCLQDKFDLKSFLTKRIRFLEDKEKFQDEKVYAEQFLAALNSSTQHQSPSPSPQKALSLMPA